MCSTDCRDHKLHNSLTADEQISLFGFFLSEELFSTKKKQKRQEKRQLDYKKKVKHFSKEKKKRKEWIIGHPWLYVITLQGPFHQVLSKYLDLFGIMVESRAVENKTGVVRWWRAIKTMGSSSGSCRFVPRSASANPESHPLCVALFRSVFHHSHAVQSRLTIFPNCPCGGVINPSEPTWQWTSNLPAANSGESCVRHLNTWQTWREKKRKIAWLFFCG